MFGQPFGSNYTDLQNHYMQQLQAMQQAQQAQPQGEAGGDQTQDVDFEEVK